MRTSSRSALASSTTTVCLVALRRKVRRWKPSVVALVGVTLYRFIFDVRGAAVSLGPQSEQFEGARVAAGALPDAAPRRAVATHLQVRHVLRPARLIFVPFGSFVRLAPC